MGPNQGNWLTVGVVEDIQRAVEKGISVASAIAALRNATPAGIVEYGCLRWAIKGLPPLPSQITSSTLGRSLAAAASDLGLKAEGPARPPLRRIDPQPAEFIAVAKEGALMSEEVELFHGRFAQSAKCAGFAQVEADRLQAALHEMLENALIHSSTPVPALVGYRCATGIVQFVVADVGTGVLASLRQCSDYARLATHNDGIRAALHDGVSRFGSLRGGLGFRSVFKALASQWGHLRFRSGEGCISMDGTGLDADEGTQHFPPPLPGFQISVTCRTRDGATAGPPA